MDLPRVEVWEGSEDPVSEFHMYVKREVVKKIGDLLDGCLFFG
jgi:hypothetical protein